jgi:hypothetical protein
MVNQHNAWILLESVQKDSVGHIVLFLIHFLIQVFYLLKHMQSWQTFAVVWRLSMSFLKKRQDQPHAIL